ncbi:CinA family nicotinamide mononucleotide deamidase-related protein [Salinivibrio sp. AR640]|uniref:CinA family nicotinamide mononucleotide deamidase-related protein n=1 Tax=Salinivibrio sp. AR640 TaxID=1909437 RepID=UPI001F5BACA2|nr:CinA family nicotinamide mononucleotide deamidase-related protein [Salinivibrio sp. AR640]
MDKQQHETSLPRIAMLSTGEEVLLGDITDTNAAWLSRVLFENGLAMSRRVTIGDELDDMAIELVRLSQTEEVVIVNGGLGPTTDDLTTAAMAAAMGVELTLNEAWLDELKQRFERRGRPMAQSNLKQAMLPEGARLIDNPKGTACGFHCQLNGCHFYFTPGVPSEFFSMVEQQILPELLHNYPAKARSCYRLFTFGLSESGISDVMASLVLPNSATLGYRSSLPFIEVKLFIEADHVEKDAVLDALRHRLADYVVSFSEPMTAALAADINHHGVVLKVAEQFTGGWLASTLNGQAAHLVEQGWVMSNAHVPEQAVANPLAASLAMASATTSPGQRQIGLACGPELHGQICVAISTPEGEWGQRLSFKRHLSNDDARCYMATVLLDMLRRYLSGEAVIADYASLTRHDDIFIDAQTLA